MRDYGFSSYPSMSFESDFDFTDDKMTWKVGDDRGNVLAYEPICGTGAAVVTLTPAEDTAGDLEYDEDDPEFYKGDREVLDFYDQPGMGPLEERDGD